MRVHRTSSGRRPGRAARLGFILVALATAAPSRAADDERPGSGSDGRVPPTISLTADRIRNWEEDGVHYVLLDDHAAVFRGDAGIRADRAAVRVVTVPNPQGGLTYEVEVFAEGRVRRSDEDGPPQPEARVKWTTAGKVNLTPSPDGTTTALSKAPPRLAILARAFGDAAPRTADRAKADAQAVAPPAGPLDGPSGPAPGDAVPPMLDAPQPDPSVRQASAEAPEEKPKVKPATRADERPIRFRDPDYKPVQFVDGPGFPDTPGANPGTAPRDAPPQPLGPPPADFGPSLRPRPDAAAPAPADEPAPDRAGPTPGFDLEPLPGVPANRTPAPASDRPPEDIAPISPGTQRRTMIYGRSGPNFKMTQHKASDGTLIYVIRGGVNIVTTDAKMGLVDIESDSAIIWRKPRPDSPPAQVGPNNMLVESSGDPMEVYLEGHVVFRQDRQKLQGRDDQVTVLAKRFYYDFLADRSVALDAQLNQFAPGLASPFKVDTPRMDMFHPLVAAPDGRMLPSTFQEMRAQQTSSTGSRFAEPGYKFNSRTLDMKKVLSDNDVPEAPDDLPNNEQRTTWRIDARQNVYYTGPVPTFYWPRFVTDVDDLDPPLRMITFRSNNFFGQQILLDFNGFKLFGIRKPTSIDLWNVDVDYLARGPALGTELGWFGVDPVRDITDPYHLRKNATRSFLTQYMGYFDIWGIYDKSVDDLGAGPAVITYKNRYASLPTGYPTRQNDPVSSDRNNLRGRINLRHMQSLLPDDADPDEDFRFNIEAGYLSDRNFLEQYYKRLYDTGLDHEDLVYGIKQQENWAATILTELNPNAFNTETQWLPRLDYYRLGDSLLGDSITYFGHTGLDYASTHTANDVHNTNTLYYLPYDPVSNTSKTLQTGRFWTAHEFGNAPINLNFLRLVPYVQGQAVGWDHQIDGSAVGRIWGAAGLRADASAWKAFPGVENELMNVHGLNHKIDLSADYRDAWSNVNLNSIGVQDDLDDNSYEATRRYFAMFNYAGGLLPYQYDPRFLMLRRTASPITASTDIQATIETLRMGLHQRLQTKRGPEGRRRIIDYVILDVDSTYFPNYRRDNFGVPFGQTTYNLEWHIGDRTSIVSYGWFEFFNIGGQPLYKVVDKNKLNPNGLDIITTGISINRPPRGNIYIGYSVIDSGLVQSSALLTTYSYWMSPKWYSTFGSSYDFANDILLNANASVTRIGKDFLTTVGLSVVPLQHSFMFAFEVAPRLSPSIGFGSGSLTRLDTRYAPKD